MESMEHKLLLAISTALSVLASCSKPPESALDKFVKAEFEKNGQDAVVVEKARVDALKDCEVVRIKVKVRDKTLGTYTDDQKYYLKKSESAYEDIIKIFTEQVFNSSPEEKQTIERLGKLLSDRYRETITVNQGLKKAVTFEESTEALFMKLVVAFAYADGTPGRYIETYSFYGGKWNYAGCQLIEKAGR